MAIKSPGFVQVTTTTTGFGPYTLTNTVPSSNDYRSIANAVSDGSLVNGDTVQYVIFQSGVPTGKMFERGWGTINTTTLVLTVVTVLERSAALTSGGGWGGGTKDVYFAPPGAESVALLQFTNTFIADQIIEKTNPALDLRVAGQVRGRLVETSDQLILGYFNNVSVIKGAVILGDGTLRWSTDLATFKNIAVLDAGKTVAQLDAGMKVVQFPGGGTVKMPFNSAPPTGWTRINTVGDVLFKFATAAESPGATGGSWTVSGLSADGHTLVDAELSSHNHGVGDVALAAAGSDISVITPGGGFFQSTTTTGGDEPHTHPISSNSLWRPPYKVVVEASFD